MFCIVFCCVCSHSPVEGEIVVREDDMEGEKEQGGKREKPVVRPEEIPPVPENRFLLRRDMPSQENKTEMLVLLLCCYNWPHVENLDVQHYNQFFKVGLHLHTECNFSQIFLAYMLNPT